MGIAFKKAKPQEDAKKFVASRPIASNKYEWRSTITPISSESDEYQIIRKICLLPYEITKVEKVYNDWIYLKYVGQKAFLSLRDNKDPNEIIVFHGSKQRHPHIICKSTGLNFKLDRQSSDNSWGNGIHFSNNIFFAVDNAYEDKKKGTRIIILAKLLIGNYVEKSKEENIAKNFKLPPLLENSNKEEFIKFFRYDLVTGVKNNTQRVFLYYENYNALPLYIITYDEKRPFDLKMPERWYWKDDSGFNQIIPQKMNTTIQTLYRKGILEKKNLMLRLLPNDEEVPFDLKLSVDKKSFLFNTKNGAIIQIYKKYLNDEDLSVELEKKLCKPLAKDLNKLMDMFKEYTFNDESIKNEVINTFENLCKLISGHIENNISVLNENDEEYQIVKNMFLKTVNAKLVSIQKIQNVLQMSKYLIQKIYIALKSNLINEKKLFHGTSQTPPENIYRDIVGFDMRYTRDNCYWGKANYFAVNASYSDDNYAYDLKSGERQLFLADVIISKHTDRYKESEKKRDLLEPPLIKNSNERYDSVYANTGGSDVYMVYENNRAYPTYLITYKKY